MMIHNINNVRQRQVPVLAANWRGLTFIAANLGGSRSGGGGGVRTKSATLQPPREPVWPSGKAMGW